MDLHLVLRFRLIYPEPRERGFSKGLNMSDYTPEVEAAVNELGGVNLPDNVTLLEVIGRGSRSIIFKAEYRGEKVALKVYRPEAVSAYRKKHNVNIAVFEMSQNRKFRKVPELLPFSAKPIMVLGHDGKQSVCFIQELIEAEDDDEREKLLSDNADKVTPELFQMLSGLMNQVTESGQDEQLVAKLTLINRQVLRHSMRSNIQDG